MSDFDERPFVAGTINGIRHFRIDRLGRLCPVSKHEAPWKPGLNTATHMGYTTQAHSVAGAGCDCGFYAFFSDRQRGNYNLTEIRGIIRAHGRVTIGSLGFRAEKAEIVALVSTGRWRTIPFAARIVAIGWLAALATLVTLASITGAAGFIIPAVTVGIVTGVLVTAGSIILTLDDDWDGTFPSGRIPPSTRALYPDVPVFRSLRRALRKFPVVPPEPLSPESDPSFWTRSAS